MPGLHSSIKKFTARIERQMQRIAPDVSSVERDWLLVLFSFCIIIVCLLAFSIYFFLTATDRSASFEQNNVLDAPKTIDRSELNGIRKSYTQREIEYNQTIENPEIPADPSQ